MIQGIGIDITDIERVRQAQAKNPRFSQRILTPKEQQVYQQLKGQHQIEFLAGRFSAKEAYSKAYGTGIGASVTWQNVEILNNAQGQPILTQQPFTGRGHISISHTATVVMTEVILEANNDD